MTVVVTHSTPADASFSATGATAWDANHVLAGVGTMAEQNANAVAITGGTIAGVTLGSYIPYIGATTAVDLNAQTLTNIAHLGLNSTAVPDILLRAYGDNNSTSRIAIRGYSSNANSSSVRIAKFRGTFASPQAPLSGDSLGKFELAGYGTTSSSGYPQVSYEGVATENWGATARGAKTLIKVTPNTTINQVTAVTIDQNSAATFAGALSVTGHTTFEGVTSTGATGTGKLVYDTSPTFPSVTLTTGTITTSPSSSTDIVNKSYADSISSGINFHAACQYATATALPTNTYDNGTGGIGATLTAVANGALTVDGSVQTVGNRVLVKNEATQANNGAYTVTTVGDGSTKYVLTRATDYDTSGSGNNEIDQGDMMLVILGTVNANTSWVQQTALPITVGTTALVFLQFAAVQTYSAGTGLTLTTNQFSITDVGTAGTYGSASNVPVFVTNAQGQVTGVTNTAIAIANTAVSGLGTMSTQSSSSYAALAGATFTGQLKLAAGAAGAGLAPIEFQSGTLQTTAEAGAMEYDGTAFYNSMAASTRGVMPSEQIIVLTGTNTLTSQTAVQPIFDGGGGTTNGAITLPVGTYQYELSFALTGMSATSGSFGFGLGGTATKTFSYNSMSAKAGTALATSMATLMAQGSAANTALQTASTGTVGTALIKGIMRVTVTGTVIPQVSLTVASAAVVQTNSYFKVSPIGNATVATVGNWS